MNGLVLYFSKFAPLSEECLDDLLDLAKYRVGCKRDHLFEAGEVCDQFCFVESGLLRSYYLWEGKEVNARFMQEGDCCNVAESFFFRTPAREYVQALEDTLICSIRYRDLQTLYNKYPLLNASARLWLEERQVLDDRRLEAMWMGQARDRYAWFSEKFPDLVKRVPGKHLASYLGISEVKMSQLMHEGC